MLLTPYARVSTTEQSKGYSIDTQLAEMEKYALASGIELTRAYTEAKSASKTGENARPEFQRALRNCLAGNADGLLMCWFDRAFRNLFEFLQTKYLLQSKGKVLYLALQPMLNLTDDDDPYTTYIQNNFVNLAELQANIIGQKARLGQLEKAKQGGWPGRVPLGYIRSQNGIIEPDPAHGDDIAAAFRAYATGRFTLSEWAAEARKSGITTNGGQPVSVGQWNKIFKNELYTGVINWAGVRVEQAHRPLVDADTWTRVQSLLTERGSPALVHHVFMLSGLLVSEVCYRLMVGTVAKGRYRYYEARAGGKTHRLKADDIERRVIKRLVGVWWNGQLYGIAEGWIIALRGLDCSQVMPLLRSEDERRDFAHRVISVRGITVGDSGEVLDLLLRSGFERR